MCVKRLVCFYSSGKIVHYAVSRKRQVYHEGSNIVPPSGYQILLVCPFICLNKNTDYVIRNNLKNNRNKKKYWECDAKPQEKTSCKMSIHL